MTKPAAMQGDGTAVPEPAQVTQAMSDFVNQFNVFQRDVKSKLETQESKMTQLDLGYFSFKTRILRRTPSTHSGSQISLDCGDFPRETYHLCSSWLK